MPERSHKRANLSTADYAGILAPELDLVTANVD
jgi:hypothetical protein